HRKMRSPLNASILERIPPLSVEAGFIRSLHDGKGAHSPRQRTKDRERTTVRLIPTGARKRLIDRLNERAKSGAEKALNEKPEEKAKALCRITRGASEKEENDWNAGTAKDCTTGAAKPTEHGTCVATGTANV